MLNMADDPDNSEWDGGQKPVGGSDEGSIGEGSDEDRVAPIAMNGEEKAFEGSDRDPDEDVAGNSDSDDDESKAEGDDNDNNDKSSSESDSGSEIDSSSDEDSDEDSEGEKPKDGISQYERYAIKTKN